MKQGFWLTIEQGKVDYEILYNPTSYDNIVTTNDYIVIALEGVILNKAQLLTDFGQKDYSTLLTYLYREFGNNFLHYLEGEFRGFIWDKTKNKVKAFTNATSTLKVFHASSKDRVCIDTHIKHLAKTRKKNQENVTVSIESMYQLLALTNLIENKTPLENVYKLLDSNYLEVNTTNNTLVEKQYYNVEQSRFSKSYQEALRINHDLFSKAIHLEYSKDNELQKPHFSLLSGGLDSRVAVLYAKKLHLKPDHAFCFSQSNYYDHKIAEKIAKDHDIDFIFNALDGGSYLSNIDRLTAFSEGMVLYLGSIHVDYAINNTVNLQSGLIHSGQIGDGILGGFNSIPAQKKPDHFKIVMNPNFLGPIQESLNQSIAKYDREELFLLRNIAFNRTVLGAEVWRQVSHQTSPFMHKDFMSFAISLPEEWKYKHRFYFDWIKHYCPESTHYIWEKSLMKPNAKWKTKFGQSILKRANNLVFNKILKREDKISMYPYQYYFTNHPQLQLTYEKYFNDNIHRIELHKDLHQDIITLFAKPDFFSKASAINILAIFKYYSDL